MWVPEGRTPNGANYPIRHRQAMEGNGHSLGDRGADLQGMFALRPARLVPFAREGAARDRPTTLLRPRRAALEPLRVQRRLRALASWNA
jgi:hypothetical protein